MRPEGVFLFTSLSEVQRTLQLISLEGHASSRPKRWALLKVHKVQDLYCDLEAMDYDKGKSCYTKSPVSPNDLEFIQEVVLER